MVGAFDSRWARDPWFVYFYGNIGRHNAILLCQYFQTNHTGRMSKTNFIMRSRKGG